MARSPNTASTAKASPSAIRCRVPATISAAASRVGSSSAKASRPIPNAYIYFITQAPVWGAICEVIGKPEWKTDPDYATPNARLPRLQQIFATIEQWTMTKTKFEAMDILNKLDIPCGPILSMKDIAHEQSLRATGTVVEVDHPTRGTYLTVGNPIKLSDSIADVRRSPLLGEHTDEVLRDVLRYSDQGDRRDQDVRCDQRAGEESRSGIAIVMRVLSRASRLERSCLWRWRIRLTMPGDDGEKSRKVSSSAMRIVVHGQQAFGKAVLEALIKRGENIVAVYVAPEKEGAKADPLKEAALAANLPVYQPDSYRKPEVWEEFRALKPDLQVMAFVTLFVPEDFLNIPTRGSIQYHPSLLPAYRGPSAINWPIIKGESETGLSIFWPDNGLDTGDVLIQKKTPISATDTLGSVYFDRLFPMGVEAMLEAIDLVKSGKAPRIKQDEAKATYEGRCGPDNAHIDWGRPWQEIDRLIRGCNPAPGAWSKLDGATVKIFDATPLPAKDPKGIAGKMGEIVAIDNDGFTVVCADGRFKVTRVQPADGKKIEAAAWAQAANVAVKARFA